MTIRALSYAHGISTTPLLNDTLGSILDKAAERWPDREAVVVRDQNVRMTFAQLRDKVDRLATGLIAWAFNRAIASASGRPTRSSGCLASMRRPRPD